MPQKKIRMREKNFFEMHICLAMSRLSKKGDVYFDGSKSPFKHCSFESFQDRNRNQELALANLTRFYILVVFVTKK